MAKNSRVYVKSYFPKDKETNQRHAKIYIDDMNYIIENYEYGKIHSTKPESYVSKELGIESAELSADAFVYDYQLYQRNNI